MGSNDPDDVATVIPGAVTQLDWPTKLPTDRVRTEDDDDDFIWNLALLLRYRSRPPSSFLSASESCDAFALEEAMDCAHELYADRNDGASSRGPVAIDWGLRRGWVIRCSDCGRARFDADVGVTGGNCRRRRWSLL